MKIVIHPDFMQTADFIKQLPQHFAKKESCCMKVETKSDVIG